ncbi:MAG: hypothetical protein ACRC28_13770 [Clostridium sp.]|uniref:hypothetical protein n=1 Tax=Clostridium sp. TaxID=1506 RepID=UPI003F2B4BD5
MRKSKASYITTGGILIALTLVVLYLAQLIQINTLTLLTVASLFVPVALIKCNLKTAWTVYIGSSILSLLLINLEVALMYTIFFGLYGVIKYLAEKKRHHKPTEILIKLVFFNISIFIYYFIFISILGPVVTEFPLYVLLIISEFVFLIYDYGLTLLIAFYMQKIHTRLK